MKKGSKMTEEQRTRVSEGHKGVMAGMSGKKHSEKSKKKMRVEGKTEKKIISSKLCVH